MIVVYDKNIIPQLIMTANTATTISKFIENVDNSKEYTLAELKDILTKAYNASKTSVANAEKVKKPPSAYNNFIKQTMAKLKQDDASIPANELMRTAASKWKLLTKQEQEQYKLQA